MRLVAPLVLLVAACHTSPESLARERGAVETVVAYPCRSGGTLGARAGGDLKTDWSAARLPDGKYRVTRRLSDKIDSWRVDLATHDVEPETPGARAATAACRM